MGNERCDPKCPDEKYTNQAKERITTTEICNASWNEKALAESCKADFASLTISQVSDMRRCEVSPGMAKLWYVSKNMLLHQPKPFHLYVHSVPHIAWLAHSPLYAVGYAEQAAHIGINYTVYYNSYPGMTGSILGPPETVEVPGGGKLFYRSTVGWRDRFSPKPLANSLEEHVLFVCSEVDQAHCSAGAAKARAKLAAKVSGRTLLQNAWI